MAARRNFAASLRRQDVVERAHDAGMAVHAWPVGSELVAAALVRRGVDGIVASRPL